jgi:hypothetical protein
MLGRHFALARRRAGVGRAVRDLKMEMAGPMTEKKGNYDIGYRKPPEGGRFKKGQSGNPSGRPKNAKSAVPLLVRKFDEQVLEVTNGGCQKTTRSEVVVVQLSGQPAAAGLSATKILTDLLQEIEKKAELSRPVKVG